MKKILITFICMFLAGAATVGAQDGRTGLDPVADSAFVNAMRARMNEIRKKRPTVALVLSGGGAKGASHIGVIKYLEQMDMPIDMVLGTSMGGLIGSMVSLGYNSGQIDHFVRTMDWEMALSDKVPRDYVSYYETKYQERYLLSIPFYYSPKDYIEKLKDDMTFSGAERKYDDLHLGASSDRSSSELLKDNILGSLPSGFVFGQNVNNVIASVTAGYQDSLDFINLPIPFVCVATEMVSGKAKVWYSGKLQTALRSTMSIPGLFAPVKTDGMVLVDGGMRNNYPTDIARMLGADLIIGVDLSSGFSDYSKLNNLLDIVWQGVDMLGREAYEKNHDRTEVTIKPVLDEFNMLSFDKESIATIINRGWEASVKQADNLAVIKEFMGDHGMKLHKRKAIDLANTSVWISQIEITGVTDAESQYLMKEIDFDIRKPHDKDALEDVVARIFATKSFDYVTYELLGDGEPFKLKIHCKKGPVHQVGFGVRFDTEELLTAAINIGLNAHRIHGSRLDFTGIVSANPMVSATHTYKFSNGPAANARLYFKHLDSHPIGIGDSEFMVAFNNFRQDLWLSNINWKRFDINFGIRNDYYRIQSVYFNDSNLGSSYEDISKSYNDYVSILMKSKMDFFDNGYFPKQGFKLELNYQWGLFSRRRDSRNFHILKFNYKSVFHISEHFALLPSIDARIIFNNAPLVYANIIGGGVEGRYFEQQIPFVGANKMIVMRPVLAMANLDFRTSITKNNYLSFKMTGGTSTDFQEESANRTGTGFAGFSFEYAYNSLLGPLKADIHWSTLTHSVGVYLGLGLEF